MNFIALSSICLLFCSVSMVNVEAMSVEQLDQSGDKPTFTLAIVENPELTIKVLENLLRSIVFSASVDVPLASTQKRGLDLGISRGFSGSQAGKHLLGLSAANFANGPGR